MKSVLHNTLKLAAICGFFLIGCSDTGDSEDDTDNENCPVGSLSCHCTLGGGCDQGLECVANVCQEIPTECPVGSENCPCTTGGVCNAGLTCEANICVAGDGEPDSGTGQDGGDSECDYPIDCFGDICDGTSPCCTGGSCGDQWYIDDIFIENYCYPSCDDQYGESGCKCDDICVALDEDAVSWCLAPGAIRINDLSIKIMAQDVLSSEFELTDISPAEIEANINGKMIPLNIAHGYIEENEAVIQMEGMGSLTDVWMAIVAIPLDSLIVGGPTAATVDPEDGTYNFWAWIYSGTIPADSETGEIDQLWNESIFDYEISTLTVDQVGAPCEVPGSQDCTFYQFDLDLSFFSLKAEME